MLPLRAGLGALFAAAALLAAACGTDAGGVDTCRRIEQARCRKAPACPELAVTSVEACNGFARDRCLHGLAVADPGVARVDQCVKAIDETSSCSVVAAPELDPACAFLVPDAGDGGGDADAATNSNDAADSTANASDADAATTSDASANPAEAEAAATASDASDSSVTPSDSGAGDATLETGAPVDGSAG